MSLSVLSDFLSVALKSKPISLDATVLKFSIKQTYV